VIINYDNLWDFRGYPIFFETRFLANAMEMSQGSGYPKWAVVKKDHQNW
jgi:hypothetical protein